MEVHEPRGIGRCRMAPLAAASAASLHAFVSDHVEPGATVVTDAWMVHRGLDRLGYTHEPHSQRAARRRGQDPGELLPAVHRVASLVKRWLLGPWASSPAASMTASASPAQSWRPSENGSAFAGVGGQSGGLK